MANADPAIGVIAPGEMGSAVGRVLVDAGRTVLWASEGRSPASKERADAAGMTDAGTVEELAHASAVLLSIVPPHSAMDTARALAVTGFTGIYVDANAIAPATATGIAETVTAKGAIYVDGGIVGPPPTQPGSTRLYLSGEHAKDVAALFTDTALEAIALDGALTSASALKMTYAAWTKGTTALLLATQATAQALGVDGALEEEWRRSQPNLEQRLPGAHAAADHKGWRWIAEMEEIAATFGAAEQPRGFHEAAAEVYRNSTRSYSG